MSQTVASETLVETLALKLFSGESEPAELEPTLVEPATVDSLLSAEPPPRSPASERSAPPSVVDQRLAVATTVRSSVDLPPGVRDRLTSLVEQTAALDATGEPLLPARQVLDMLAQGLPTLLRRETTPAVSRLAHPTGDAFFQHAGDDLSDQQAEQIARGQLQRAGLLAAA